jgi:hypothetical protein
MKIFKAYLLNGIIITVCLCLLISSCKHDPGIQDNFPEICFEKDVLPIFQNSCSMTGCHDGQGESKLILDNYTSISHNVVPYNPDASSLYQAIISSKGENKMPPDKPLPIESRTVIRLWIEQGAWQTTCVDSSTIDPGYINTRACFSRDILPVLISNCAITGCHDAITHKEGYVFTSYTSVMKAVSPGNPGGSKLYNVLNRSGEEKMPPSPYPSLSSEAKDSIAAWIRYGALNEFCGEVCDTINPVTFSGTIWPIMENTCLGCHRGSTPSGGVALTGYADVSAVASNGLLMKALTGNGVTKMPPSGSFSACRIRQFEIWINNGYPDN